jgi:hypothetical protein
MKRAVQKFPTLKMEAAFFSYTWYKFFNAHGVMFQKVVILIQKKIDRLPMKQLHHDGAHLAATVTGVMQLVLPAFLQPPSARPPAACWLGHLVHPVQALEAPPYGVSSPVSVSFKSPCRCSAPQYIQFLCLHLTHSLLKALLLVSVAELMV